MITCEKCRSQFAADRNIGYPGHCDPPNALLTYSVAFGIVAAACAAVGVFAFRGVMFSVAAAFLFGALAALIRVREARELCERSGGGNCPSCGHANQVTWHS